MLQNYIGSTHMLRHQYSDEFEQKLMVGGECKHWSCPLYRNETLFFVQVYDQDLLLVWVHYCHINQTQ